MLEVNWGEEGGGGGGGINKKRKTGVTLSDTCHMDKTNTTCEGGGLASSYVDL